MITTLFFAALLFLIAFSLFIALKSIPNIVDSWLALQDKGGKGFELGTDLGVVIGGVLGGVLGGRMGGVMGSGLGIIIDSVLGIVIGSGLGGVLSGMLGDWLERMRGISRKRPTKAVEAPDNDHPPQFAEYLLFYLPKKIREPLLGDLEEEYREISARFGKRKATTWYYVQVGISYWPLLCRAARKLVKWGVLGWVGDAVRRLIS